MNNLFNIDAFLSANTETINNIIDVKNIKIEQIISTGQGSEPGFWYDQTENEWVTVLKGRGVIEYKDKSTVTLTRGDSLLIPAHTLHRVKETANPTIWLAVFFKS